MTPSLLARRLTVAAAFAMSGLTTTAFAATPSYTFTDISIGNYPNVADINNLGQVAGSAYVDVGSGGDVDIEHRGFLYSQGQWQILGALGSTIDAYGATNSYSAARALNNAGHVVGESDTASTVYDSRGHAYGRAAFSWSQGQISPLPNAAVLTPLSINNQGHIAGMVGEIDNYAGTDSRVASLYANGQLTQLNQLGLGSTAAGINSKDQVVGTYSLDRFNGLTHAFLYENGQVKDLGTLGGSNSVGSAINDAGQITGWSQLGGGDTSHAFVYDKGLMKDLGLLAGLDNTLGRDINAQGVVVGTAFSGYDVDKGHAFVYSDGGLHDLNTLVDAQARQGWLLTDAIGINDQGTIIGHAMSGQERRLFMLTPVPEPQAWAMALGGLMVAGSLLRQRQSRSTQT